MLSKLLNPQSVAVIGASTNPSKISGIPLTYLRDRFSGSVFVVNSQADHVQGVEAVNRVDELPAGLDAALILLPSKAAVEAAKACARLGFGAVIVIGGGFAESGNDDGVKLQEELTLLAQESGMRILGPNSVGVITPALGYYATFSATFQETGLANGGIALIGASGGMLGRVLPSALAQGLGFRYICHPGNECDIDLSELLMFCVESEEVSVVALYLEGLGDLDGYARAFARAQEMHKPVVALKGGKSRVGEQAVVSHTGAIAGSASGFEALARRYGVALASTADDFTGMCSILSGGKRPQGSRFAIVSPSGGAGVLQADLADSLGVDVPSPSAELRSELEAVLPDIGSADNPIDTTASIFQFPADLGKVVRMLAGSNEYDGATVMLGGLDELAKRLLDAVVEVASEFPMFPMAIIWEAVSEATYQQSVASGLPTFRSAASAFQALALTRLRPGSVDPHVLAAGPPVSPSGRKLRHPADAPAWLSAVGVPVVESQLVSDPAEVSLEGNPGAWVAKLAAERGLSHRSEHQGVRVGLSTAHDVDVAVRELLSIGRQVVGEGARVEIQPHIYGELELLVSIRRDPVYGWLLTIGSGGYMAEIVAETATVLAPSFPEEVRAALQGLFRGRLTGHPRGLRGDRLDEVISICTALASAVHLIGDGINEIELNPLIVGRDQIAVVDWLVVGD